MSIPAPTAAHDIDLIDLDRHGLIEASAGTGKTYTIENLVIRLLKEKPALHLENILMVTYTEKAASDLKIRIREKIENVLNDKTVPRAMTVRMSQALDEFDAASIQTIHGFCHSLLRDFSFENDTLFQTELIDDRPLYEKVLKAQMRSIWPKRYGRLLPQLLSISGFTQNPTHFLKTIITIAAGGYCPEAGDRLHPDPNSVDTQSLIREFDDAKTALKSLTGPTNRFIDGYQQLNFHAGSKKAIIARILVPLETWLYNSEAKTPDLAGFADVLAAMQAYQKFKDFGPDAIKPQKYNRGKDNSGEMCPNLNDLIASLTDLIQAFNSLKHILSVETIVRLRKEVIKHKRITGSITYDDMLTSVYAALNSPQANLLLDRLRKQYRYAFVDEFQDTDPIQWRIFERIFLESDACRLFLIGDPKQAIYSFRGADVFTYLSARFKLRQLAGRHFANHYALDINYRSEPSLVTEYNRLFAHGSWFGLSEKTDWHEIRYSPVTSPDTAALPVKLVRDDSGRSALNLIDLRGPEKPTQANADLTRFIAAEIAHLIGGDRLRIQGKDDTIRPLDSGDIAILVRSRTNVNLLEDALDRKNIPHSYYRKPGLFASDEAWFLSLVLHAVLDSSNDATAKKALLTPFFEWKSEDLSSYDDLPATHSSRQLLVFWQSLAIERRWGELFQSIMTDSGLIFRQSQKTSWDRMETNYNQIIAFLTDAAYRNNLDFARMCAHLAGLRRQTLTAGEKGDIHEIETESRKVQILTMHRAKGLQFPVVFIAGGLTRGGGNAHHQFHPIDRDDSGNTKKIIDLTCKANPKRHQKELIDEDKRLFYVALTRAQLKLYVPFFPALTTQPYFGPVCRFVAQAIETCYALPPKKRGPITWLKAKMHDVTHDDRPPAPAIPSQGDVPPDLSIGDLLPTETVYVHRSVDVESFSSIHAKQTLGASPASIHSTFVQGSVVDREDDEHVSLPDLQNVASHQPADDIPGGPEVGSMFHGILETIDFETIINEPAALFGDSPTAKLINQQMALYNIDLTYRAHVAQVIVDALTCPIPQIEESFHLGKLPPAARLHEVDFYYATPSISSRYIRGVIDLVFRHDNKYYIADWKSNRLDAGYNQASMTAGMDAADYHLQYKLYSVAVLRWLTHIMGNRFNVNDHFGGVFYFFLRGMGLETGQGIFYIPPDEIGSLPALEASVADINLKIGGWTGR